MGRMYEARQVLDALGQDGGSSESAEEDVGLHLGIGSYNDGGAIVSRSARDTRRRRLQRRIGLRERRRGKRKTNEAGR